MNLIEYIKENKMSIIILIFLLYLVYQDISNVKTIERMTNSEPDLWRVIKKYYRPNRGSIKKLGTLLKGYLANGFELPGNLTVKTLSVSNNVNFLVPGTIIAFHGTAAPEGWLICDGNNGTPDLRSKMILGSGQGGGLTLRNLDTSGGVENVTLTVNQMPSHKHTINPAGNHNHTLDIGNFTHRHGGCKDAHGHDGNGRGRTYTHPPHRHVIGSAGGNEAHNNMPPFYSLLWIMKKPKTTTSSSTTTSGDSTSGSTSGDSTSGGTTTASNT